jgi:C-terminal processing protease CtpA/Prc
MHLATACLASSFVIASTPWTQEQLAGDFEWLAAAVRDQWSYFEFRTADGGLDFEALVAGTRERLRGVETPSQLETVLCGFLAELRDGHAGLFVPGVVPATRRLPFALDVSGDSFVVSATLPSTDSPHPELGDVVLAIDRRPMHELFASSMRRTFGSTESGRISSALRTLRFCEAETVTVEWRTPDGATRNAPLPTILPGDSLRRGVPDPPNWSLSWPEDDVALLRISSFAVVDWQGWLAAKVEERDAFLADTFAEIDRTFTTIEERQPRVVILDLRGNAGGTDRIGIELAKHLIAGEFQYFLLSGKLAGQWRSPHGSRYRAPPEMPRYHGDLIALIDGHCFSATDNFLRCLDDLHPRFTTIGRATGGGTGAPREIATLEHSGVRVTLCTMRVLGPKGAIIEGRGTEPDVRITWHPSDHRDGRDPDLAAALARR